MFENIKDIEFSVTKLDVKIDDDEDGTYGAIEIHGQVNGYGCSREDVLAEIATMVNALLVPDMQ